MTRTKRTERGFAIYAEFADSYGSEIRVQESSSAEGPHVWIFCRNVSAPNMDPHLTPAQARRVRDALDRFLRHRAPSRKVKR